MDDQMNQVGVGPHEAERAQGSGAVGPGRGGRMSRQRKGAAVLRLLRGEDLETISRELGVTAATLTNGHDGFPAAGDAAWPWSAAGGGSPARAFIAARRCRRRGSGADRSVAMSDDALTAAIQD